MSIVHQAPWTGVVPINPRDIVCPADGCDDHADTVCALPGKATSGVRLCSTHAAVLARIISTGRGMFIIGHTDDSATVTLDSPPVTRGEWERVRVDLVAILHDLHHPAATTKGH